MAPRIPDIPSSTDLSGCSVLVTGSNTGIGFENARQFLQLKASPVYLAVRSIEKGNAAKAELLSDATVKKNNPNARIEVYQLDLASFASVSAFGKKFAAEAKTLNIAVLNAGVSFFKFVPTVDKYETVFQVNYASNALLSAYLLPILKAGADTSHQPSHLSFVSSSMQNMNTYGRKLPIKEDESIFDYYNKKENMGMDRYNLSKLLVSMWSDELARHVRGEDVIITSMCPGLVQTNFDQNSPGPLKYFMKFVRSVAARSPAEGGRAVTLASLEGKHGKYYSDATETEISAFSRSEPGRKLQKRLWDESWQRFKEADPEVPVVE